MISKDKGTLPSERTWRLVNRIRIIKKEDVVSEYIVQLTGAWIL